MFTKEAIKTTAFCSFLLIAFLVTFAPKASAQVQTEGNCKEINGRFYITNEFYRVCTVYQNPLECSGFSTLDSYASADQCNNASVQKYGCSPAVDGKVLYGFANESSVNFTSRVINQAEASNCLESLKKPQENTNSQPAYCREGVKFFQCKCSKTLVGEAGTLGSAISWVTGFDTYSCYLKPIREPFLIKQNPVTVNSPLGLMKQGVNLLFYLAVLVVIINLLRVGIMYVQSEGIPDDLKKARELMSNTLSGMVFFIVVVGLINYLSNVFSF